MDGESDGDLYRDPKRRHPHMSDPPSQNWTTRRRLADDELGNAVQDAVRSEQLTRDADHARHIAETTDEPALQRQAQILAYEAASEADVAESGAWRGFRAADTDDRAADSGPTESAAVEPEYDSPQRRERFADRLESDGIDHEVVASRVRADVGQARPATAINRRQAKRIEKQRSGLQPRSRTSRNPGRSR